MNKTVIARCPASCGELVQGLINGREQLVSLPVNLYSNVRVTFGSNQGWFNIYPKVFKAITMFLNSIDIESTFINKLNIDIDSQIPLGKGMASSTADIVAAVFALSKFLEYPILPIDIARIAVQVEPTDSTIFEQLTIFDHLKGDNIEILGPVPYFDLVIFEGPGMVDTLSFRRDKNYYNKVQDRKEPILNLKKGLEANDLTLIGKAATESAILNQELLNKPYLNSLIELVHKNHAYGVSIAHSGTVCGILCSDKTDLDALMHPNIIRKQFEGYIEKSMLVQTVKGGPELLYLD